jgi:hypothetical protein
MKGIIKILLIFTILNILITASINHHEIVTSQELLIEAVNVVRENCGILNSDWFENTPDLKNLLINESEVNWVE